MTGMSQFELPKITPEARPECSDAGACEDWLRTVPLINVGPSHNRLLGQTEELNCFEVDTAERLKIIELLVEPIAFVQVEHAKKFAGKPVPLTKQEREIFQNVIALWDSLLQGYLRCLNSIMEGESAVAGHAALVCQRALWCLGQRMAEHYKCFQQIGSEEWTILHRVFRYAESRGVLGHEVSEPTHKSEKTTCQQTYIAALLIHLACDPSEQTAKQMSVLRRWLERWAPKVNVRKSHSATEPGLPPVAVDLASSRGPVHETPSGDSARFLDLGEVSKSIRSRVAQMRKGETPLALGLGEDIAAAAAEQLLLVVHRHWCEQPKTRASARRPVVIAAQLCAGLASMHYHISGKPFRQPGQARELSKEQREEIATFGRVASRQDDEYSLAQGFALEDWTIREESLGGLRIECSRESGKGRYVQHQLIAVRPADAKTYMLGMMRWLQVSDNFELRSGVRVLPGVPRCVAVRATGLNVMSENYIQALLLPPVPALQTQASLILPAGWFRPKRVVEVYTDAPEQILLTGIVDRGSDFERVSFGAP